MQSLKNSLISVVSIFGIELADFQQVDYFLKFSIQISIGVLTIIYLSYQIKKIRYEINKKYKR